MIECPHCQEKIPEGVEFCIFCGERVNESSDPPKEQETKVSGKSTGGTIAEAPVLEALQSAPSTVNELASGPESMGELLPGAIVDGKYEIERVLGEGGMGVVYLARDIHTSIEVVIKAIRPEYAHREDFRRRILQEGRSLAKIDHPNVVRLNAVVVEDEGLFLVMQFIDGESLADRVAHYVQNDEEMPLAEVYDLFSQILEGVGAAHQQGVIHRDLKPPNILIRQSDGVVKVTDFGIAKPEEEAKAGRGQTKGIIGSLHYMAPEQLLGHKDLDKRVDIYGLGILLFELLTGHVPFDGPSDYDIMKLHVEGVLPLVSDERSDTRSELDEVIAKACAKDRDQRFSSTEEFLAALGPAIKRASLPDTLDQQPVPEGLVSSVPEVEDQPPESPSGPPASDDSEPRKPKSKVGIVIFLVLVAVAGIAIAAITYQMGMWEPLWEVPGLPTKHKKSMQSRTVVLPSAAPSASTTSHEEKLDGRKWREKTGIIYQASTKKGKEVELRLMKAGELSKRGYVDHELRFTLTPVAGSRDEFDVVEVVRPVIPKTLSYDSKRSRSSCRISLSSVRGKPLRARLEGNRLTMDVVNLRASKSVLKTRGRKVVGCRNLSRQQMQAERLVLTRMSP